jgi:hypothetical protein
MLSDKNRKQRKGFRYFITLLAICYATSITVRGINSGKSMHLGKGGKSRVAGK